MIPRLAVTPGEPGGIGPELLAQLAFRPFDAELVAVCDPQLLRERATAIGLNLRCETVDFTQPPQRQSVGAIKCLPIKLRQPSQAGKLNRDNAAYVIETLQNATDHCLNNVCQAMVTGPVQKSVINDAGIPFSGHTEFLAERCDVSKVVMMLATDKMRVALMTTHLPLRAVADAINRDTMMEVCGILHSALKRDFGYAEPRVMVLGLNPHAGEGGHLGHEEIDTITPCIKQLNARGYRFDGPFPADTAFTPKNLEIYDAVLAMYHDQGLPVLKYQGFGNAVNITLGLPIIRTSVDHGTALDLAGTGRADVGSFAAAVGTAIEMASAKASQKH